MINQKKILNIIKSYSIIIFFFGGIILIVSHHLFNKHPTIIFYITTTAIGVFLVSVFLDFLFSLKHIDLDYFRNVIIGVAGGLAVWVFSGIDFSFKNGFWLSINNFLSKSGIALMIIIIGYTICKKKK